MPTQKPLLLAAMFVTSLLATAFAEEPPAPAVMPHQTMQAVPFTQVQIAKDAPIWGERLTINREVSIPHNFAWCEKTGRFTNFAKAAGLMEGDFEGIYFNDSDVYKLLEGVAYCLQLHPDKELQKKADAVIDWIAKAQQPNGYINTYYELREPDKKWTSTAVMHELYCGGHMAEAAVAYAQATGETKLLDVTEKFMDHIMTVFGPEAGKRVEVPGHEEIELALVKLYQYTGKKKYFDLAEFFINARGDQAKRTDTLHGVYSQDHKPVREQTEPVGHAVRAMYLFAGMADVAAYTGDEELKKALEVLWNDVTCKKLYITGGVGARHEGEAFGDAFELPNQTAYCETCAGIGLAFWAHRMNLMTCDAKYADVVERALYNNILAGIGRDGKSFFYVNPLASNGDHHRQPFYDCACCPTNVVRFLPSLPEYVYATHDPGMVSRIRPNPNYSWLKQQLGKNTDGENEYGKVEVSSDGKSILENAKPGVNKIMVNLFIPGKSTIQLGAGKVEVAQETNYPWDGKVKLTFTPQDKDVPDYEMYEIAVRIPQWCEGTIMRDELRIGTSRSFPPREWGDAKDFENCLTMTVPYAKPFSMTFTLPMQIFRNVANPHVDADRGRVAIQRGPLVYCFEQCDNEVPVNEIVLARNPEFTETFEKDLLGGITVIKCKNADGRALTAVPYFAWDSRKPGKMAVWVRQQGLTRTQDVENTAWVDEKTGEPILYRRLADDMLTGGDSWMAFMETFTPSASFRGHPDTAEALLNEMTPKDSCDHGIPRLTFWPHKGTAEWAAVEREKPFKTKHFGVYWFDDTGRGECRVPKSATLSYKDGDQWKKIDVAVGVAKDTLNTVEFPEIETTGMRLDVQLQDGVSAGVLQLKLQ